MILSIDFRTDIPAFYPQWILNRFKEGFLYFKNPMAPSTLHKVILDKEHIEGIFWCSKNYAPILNDLHNITDVFPSVFHYTITGYNKDIEPNVPDLEQTIATFQELSKRYGKEKVIWRFDPIFYTTSFGEEERITAFEYLCNQLHDYTDRVVVNFCTPYDKVIKHMPEIIFLNDKQKESIILKLLDICKHYNLKLQMCGNGLQFKNLDGIEITGCLDEHVLNLMNVYPSKKSTPSQFGCMCYPNTSIGEYNTCLHKCKYCYASYDFDKCDENYNLHDPESPILIGWPKLDQTIIEMKPKKLNTGQLTFL